jgi:hypothetical protein
MNLAPLHDSEGCVIDFEWTRINNMAVHWLIGRPIELLGQRLVSTMAEHPDGRRLFEMYRDAAAGRTIFKTQSRSAVGTDTGAVVHTVDASGQFVSVVLHSPAAMARAAQAGRVVRAIARRQGPPVEIPA